MEKLAYGLSLLTVLYIVFLYLTTKTLIKDGSSKSFSFDFKKRKCKKENDV